MLARVLTICRGQTVSEASNPGVSHSSLQVRLPFGWGRRACGTISQIASLQL